MGKKRIGIYQILCLDAGEKYVGASRNLFNRKRQHFHELKYDVHRNPRLQRDYNLFGKRSFVFSILEILEDIDILFDREQYWIDILLPRYNAELKAGYAISHVKKPEVRAKISQSMKGVWQDSEYRANYSKVRGSMPSNRKGAKLSQETKEKLRQASSKTYDGVVSPEGEVYNSIYNMKDFCLKMGLDKSCMYRVMSGKSKAHKGWTKV